MKKAFKNRIKTLITKCVEVRLLLIQKGKSKNDLTWDDCKRVVHEIEVLRSDQQLVGYLLTNENILQKMIPGPNKKMREKLNQLIIEAQNYQK